MIQLHSQTQRTNIYNLCVASSHLFKYNKESKRLLTVCFQADLMCAPVHPPQKCGSKPIRETKKRSVDEYHWPNDKTRRPSESSTLCKACLYPLPQDRKRQIKIVHSYIAPQNFKQFWTNLRDAWLYISVPYLLSRIRVADKHNNKL